MDKDLCRSLNTTLLNLAISSLTVTPPLHGVENETSSKTYLVYQKYHSITTSCILLRVASNILFPARLPGSQISSCTFLQSAPCSHGQTLLPYHQTVSENPLRVSDIGLRRKAQGKSWIGSEIQVQLLRLGNDT